MEGIAETQFIGDLFNEFTFVMETSRGYGHLQLHEILIGALVVESFEEPTEIGLVHVTSLGDILERLELEVVFTNEFTTRLVRGKGRRLRGRFGQCGFGDLQDQQLDQGRRRSAGRIGYRWTPLVTRSSKTRKIASGEATWTTVPGDEIVSAQQRLDLLGPWRRRST